MNLVRYRGDAIRIAAALLLPVLANAGCASIQSTRVENSTSPPPESARDSDKGTLEKREGLLNTYVDAKAGKVWLEVPANPEQFLYVEGLRAGLGSNPVGLDRGELGETRLIEIRRVGGRVLIVQPNLRFRAAAGSAEEKTAAGKRSGELEK